MSTAAHRFDLNAGRMAKDREHRARIRGAMRNYEDARGRAVTQFRDWEAARGIASAVKRHAQQHLDRYLEQYAEHAEARGTKVHWAEDAAEAREIILKILSDAGAKRVVKSKVMTSEEIELNPALEEAGFDVVESDLGEFIVQLRNEHPYHFVFPAMHLNREEIGATFTQELDAPSTTEPEALTQVARRELRRRFMEADVGICGANFAVAETGMISITENEGNARLTCSLPRIQIALLGIEKVIPRLDDLALFLPMLSASGTGQSLTGYNSLYGGPRQEDAVDGPEVFHVVLLDNRRTALLADPEQRDALYCIRCGACLNICPVYRTIGGHAYGTTYQGPIGSVLTPHFKGLRTWHHLASASSLCGACTEICPVKIDLHHHLLQTRRNAAASPGNPERRRLRAFGNVVNHPRIYRLLLAVLRGLQRMRPLRDRLMKSWTAEREAPEIAQRSFRAMWKGEQER